MFWDKWFFMQHNSVKDAICQLWTLCYKMCKKGQIWKQLYSKCPRKLLARIPHPYPGVLVSGMLSFKFLTNKIVSFQVKQNSTDNMDDHLANNHDRDIPPLRISSRRHPLCCDRVARGLLRCSVCNNDSNCFRAFRFETFRDNIQLHAARQPNWCTSLLCSSCWLRVRYRGGQPRRDLLFRCQLL